MLSSPITPRQRRRIRTRIKIVRACRISLTALLWFLAGYGLLSIIGDL